MNKLNRRLEDISKRMEAHDISNESVSSASVGWHIDHMLLTINGIIRALEKSDPTKYRWQFNLSRLFILNIGIIPRGSAKSPKSVVPKDFTYESLVNHLEVTKKHVNLLADLPKHSFFVHPYFGSLKLKNAKRFIEIHTAHHLKIIRDIIRHDHKT